MSKAAEGRKIIGQKLNGNPLATVIPVGAMGDLVPGSNAEREEKGRKRQKK